MVQCNRCGEEITFKQFGEKWVPWDERRDQAHNCPGRQQALPKKKDEPLRREVAPPRDDRVVSPPAAQEETKITKMWVKYGESVVIDGHTREYGLTLQVEIAPFTNFWDEAQITKKAIQVQIARWSEEDRSRVGGP